VADGLAFAVLPLALRARCDLQVNAPLSRSALRNLRELAEAWNSWSPQSLYASKIRCDAVIDEPRQLSERIAVAWSGDLRSTFALAGGEPSVAQAHYHIASGVYVTGLGEPTAALDSQIKGIAEQFAAAGKDLTVVETNASTIGLIDPGIGVLPLVSAALHLVSFKRFGVALHGVSEPVRAQGIRPRRIPSLADFYSGDSLRIAAVGGTSSAPGMVRHLAKDRFYSSFLSQCRTNGFSERRCHACYECELLDLGLSGAGLATPPSAFGKFPLASANHLAEAALALTDWQGSPWRRFGLAARLTAQEVARASRERTLWRKALRGEEEPWPR